MWRVYWRLVYTKQGSARQRLHCRVAVTLLWIEPCGLFTHEPFEKAIDRLNATLYKEIVSRHDKLNWNDVGKMRNKSDLLTIKAVSTKVQYIRKTL